MTDHGDSTPTASRRISRPTLFLAGSLLLCALPAPAQTITVSSGTATVSGTGTSVVGGGTIFGGASISTTNYATGQVGGNPNVGPYINLNV